MRNPAIRKIHGSTLGLKADPLRRLAHLLRRRVPAAAWITPALAQEMAQLAAEIGRMVGVVLDRRGHVRELSVGDAAAAPLPPLREPPGTRARLNGLRFFATVPAGRRLGDFELARLRRHRLDALGLVVLAGGAAPCRVERAYLLPPNPEGREWQVLEPLEPGHLPEDFAAHVAALEEEFRRRAPGGHGTDAGERVVVVGTVRAGEEDHLAADLAELRSLVRSSGGRVVGEVVQRRLARDPKTLVRAGKVDELNLRALWSGADLVVFLEDLSPSQVKNLVDATGLKIIDRTQLILDIFAQRAATREGKIQVELARLRYLLPRLAGKGQYLSRLGGGIGSNRGMGEKRLELDRRHIQERIDRLGTRLEEIGRARELRRKKRQRARLPVLALVGYTNAGKTTWLNRLTGAGGRVEDRLFSTLETTARRIRLPSHRYALVTDTVGFIRDLPADLKATFHASLEELRDATLLLHVADAAHPDVFARVEAVEALLAELGLDGSARLLLYNQADRLDRRAFAPLIADDPQARLVSARSGADVTALRRALDDALDRIPGVGPRPIPRHLEVEEHAADEAEPPAAPEAHAYVDLLESAPPPVPRPGDDHRER
ncbi:MAG: GTPase HflX, partial [Planctomycetes bacterium]|nr:GTPase HflX [Planctomycetota bacterium]